MLLFVAGAVLGEGQVSLFVAGAALGEGQVLLFVAGAVLGDFYMLLASAKGQGVVIGWQPFESNRCHPITTPWPQ